MYFLLYAVLGVLGVLGVQTQKHPGLSLLQSGPNIVSSLLNGVAVSLVPTTFNYDATAWLDPAWQNPQSVPGVPVYIQRTSGGAIGSPPALCVAALFDNGNNNGNTINNRNCFRALAGYIGTRDLRSRLNEFVTALDELQGATTPTVKQTNEMKTTLESAMAEIIGTSDRAAFAQVELGSRSRLTTPASLVNKALATRRFEQALDTQVAVLRGGVDNMKTIVNIQDGNQQKLFTARDAKLAEMTASVKTAMTGLWGKHRRNMERLTDEANAGLLSLEGNVSQASRGWTAYTGLASEVYAALSEVESSTVNRLTGNIEGLNGSLNGFDTGLDEVIRNSIEPLLANKQAALTETLGQIATQYTTRAEQARQLFTTTGPVAVAEYNGSFKLDLDTKAFGAVGANLNVTVENQTAVAGLKLTQLMDTLMTRQDALVSGISGLRESDKAAATGTAAAITQYKAEAAEKDNALVAQGHELVGRIEDSQSKLSAQMKGDASASMGGLFQNIIDSLSKIAETKKASLADANAKLANMDATVANLLAASGLSSEEFFQQVEATVATLKANKAAMTATAAGGNSQSNGQTRSMGSGVLNAMNGQAFAMAQNAADAMADMHAAELAAQSASVDVELAAKNGSLNAVKQVQAASTQANANATAAETQAAKAALLVANDLAKVSASVKAIEGKIADVFKSTSAAGVDQFARFEVSASELAELAKSIETEITKLFIAVKVQANKDINKEVRKQNNRVITRGQTLTKSLSRLSDTLTKSETDFVSTVDNLKVATVQDALEKISASIATVWNTFSTNALNAKIPVLYQKSPVDLAQAQNADAKAVLDATPGISDYVTGALSNLGVDAAVNTASDGQSDLTGAMAALRAKTQEIYGSSDGVLSSSSDSAKSGIADVLLLAQKVSNLVAAVPADFADVNKTILTRKSAADNLASDFVSSANAAFFNATKQLTADYGAVMTDATTKSGDLKTLLDSIGGGSPPQRPALSMAAIQELLSNLTTYLEQLPQMTGDLQKEGTNRVTVNLFAPILKFLQLAHTSLDASASGDAGSLVSQVGLLSSAVAQSTWNTVQAARTKAATDLARSASESKLNNQIGSNQMEKISDILDAQVNGTKSSVDAFFESVAEQQSATADAMSDAKNEVIQEEANVQSQFSQVSTDLANLQSGFNSNLLSSLLATGDLTKSFDEAIASFVLNLMGGFVDMGDRLSAELPKAASDSVDLEHQRIFQAVKKVTRSINSNSLKIARYYANANSTSRSVQTLATKIENMSKNITSTTAVFSELQSAAVAAAETAADEVIEDERVRITEEVALVKEALAKLKSDAVAHLAQLST